MKKQPKELKATLMQSRKAFGANIRKFRYQDNLSQKGLAASTGLELSTIHRLESAKTDTSLSTLSRLRTHFKCRWDQLLEGV